MGFGEGYSIKNKRRFFLVFGPFGIQQFKTNSELDMGFNDPKHLLELSIHEFGHSFVNPIMDQLPTYLIDQTNHLFPPIQSDRVQQGYSNWKSCLYEHFVRTGEIIIAQNLGRKTETDQLKSFYINTRKFIYLPTILMELDQYNRSKNLSYSKSIEKTIKRLNEN